MKNSYISRIYLIITLTVLAVSAGVFAIVYFTSNSAILNDRMVSYSIGLSILFILIVLAVTYILISRTAVPYVKKLTYTDVLTGYENRMAFEHRLREVGDHADKGETTAMIIFDLNCLKDINDTNGHEAGDTYIKNTVDIIFENLQGSGPLYRIGGDEFATIIVGKNEVEIEKFMHAMRTENRKVLENRPFDCACGSAFFIVGVDRTMRDVFKRADDAMYEDKKRQKRIPKIIQKPGDSTLDILIARQPIYDKRLKVFGYELLYRNNRQKNSFNEQSRDYATASVIAGAFLNFGIESLTDQKIGFINFTDKFLDVECIKTLPARHLGIEILESTIPTSESLKACNELSNLGYTLALDDYVIDSVSDEFLQYAKIIKVDFLSSSDEHARAVVKRHKGKGIKFIAEKIETKEAYEKAKAYGYNYFQGYYFSRPAMITSTLVSPLHINVLRLLSLMRDDDCDIHEIADIITYDPGMVHKLFRLANSVAFGAAQKVDNLNTAIMRIGLSELRLWLFFMLTHNIYSEKPSELVKQSMLRARAAEEISKHKNLGDNPGFSLVGLFSMLDAIMDAPFDMILSGIPMPDKLKNALTNPERDTYGSVVSLLRAYDRADWNEAEQSGKNIDLSLAEYGKIYLDAVSWCDRKCADFAGLS